MEITDAMINKFIDIYQSQFGIKLTTDQAREKGMELVQLVKLVYQPIPNDHYDYGEIIDHTN